jgi:hypothetical protein
MTQPPLDTPPPIGGRGITRRDLLRRGATGGGTLLVVAAGGLGYRAYDEGVFQTGQGGAYDAWRDWKKQRGPMGLVSAAILAANPHNTQAWVFRVSATRIDLYADRRRNIGAVDPLYREMYVGLGTALENLMLAAAANGYEPKLTLLPSPGDPVHTATVDLSPGPVRPTKLYVQIPHRHTDRSAYRQRPVPSAALIQMSGLDNNRWFRHDWDAIQRYKDGLTLDGQGLPELTTAIAKILPATSRSYNDKFWVEHTRDPQTKTAAAYGIIAVPDPSDYRQRINGGRLLERVHLWTAGHGISLGHMNQITERIDRERQLGLTPKFQTAAKQLIPDQGFEQLVAFRIGYPASNDGRRLSPRRPAAAVVV